MSEIVVSKATVKREGDREVVSSRIRGPRGQTEIWFAVEAGSIQRPGDAFLVAALLPAMMGAERLVVEDVVSGELLEHVEEAQQIYRQWIAGARVVAIDAPRGEAIAEKPERGIGAFFTGGVDSFYTLGKHREEIETLIFCHGFGINLRRTELRRQVSERLGLVAKENNKRLMEIESNLFADFAEKYILWDDYHGSALGATGLLLSGRLRRIYIASGRPYADLGPWGSHPLLDVLWRRNGYELIHDGCEASRIDKLKLITGSPLVLKHIRVCPSSESYNCGRCRKCLRSMASLRAIGALERCTSFERPLSLVRLACLFPNKRHRLFLRHILDELRASGRDLPLRIALRAAILKHREYLPTKSLNRPYQWVRRKLREFR